MWRIDNNLGVGLVMYGCDNTMLDADVFVQNFNHWRQTVCRAGRGCQEVMLLWVIQVVINPHDNIEGALLNRCCHNDLFNTLLEVGI